MQSKLFHGLIATFVSITVSIPDITLAGNHQPETLTLSQLQCIHRMLQERAEHDERAQLVESDMHNKFTILKKLAVLDQRSIVYICLNDDLQTFTEIQRDYLPKEVFQNDNYIEQSPINDTHVFFSDLISDLISDLNKIGNETWKAIQQYFPPRVPQKGVQLIRPRGINLVR